MEGGADLIQSLVDLSLSVGLHLKLLPLTAGFLHGHLQAVPQLVQGVLQMPNLHTSSTVSNWWYVCATQLLKGCKASWAEEPQSLPECRLQWRVVVGGQQVIDGWTLHVTHSN